MNEKELEIQASFKKSKTLHHIVSLLDDENMDKFNNSEHGDAIHFPFDLENFCRENDLKLDELEKLKNER